MTDNSRQIIEPLVGEQDALEIISQVRRDVPAHVERLILYPYYRFDATFTMPAIVGRKFGKRRLGKQVCLVDALSGIAATADPFRLLDEVSIDSYVGESVVGESLSLPIRQSPEKAARAAHRRVTQTLSRQFRTIASFDLQLEARSVVQKLFWQIRADGSDVVVDSRTGGMHPLSVTNRAIAGLNTLQRAVPDAAASHNVGHTSM